MINDKFPKAAKPREDRLLLEILLSPEAIIPNALRHYHVPVSPSAEWVAVRGSVHPVHARWRCPYESNPDWRISPGHISREGAGVLVAVASLPLRQWSCSQIVPVRPGAPRLATSVVPTVELLRGCQSLAAGFPARVRRTEWRVARQGLPAARAELDIRTLLKAAFVCLAVHRDICAGSRAGANGAAVLGTEVALVYGAILARVAVGVEARADIGI